jgi:hypothetical protein
MWGSVIENASEPKLDAELEFLLGEATFSEKKAPQQLALL